MTRTPWIVMAFCAATAYAQSALEVRQVSSRTGFVTFAGASKGISLAGASAEERALNFVDVYGEVFGLAGRSHVRVTRSHADELGIEHVRMQQMHRGVPITGAEFIVHLKGSRAIAANGRAIADLPDDVNPSLRPEAAVDEARAVIAKIDPQNARGVRYSKPRLEILNRSFLSGEGSDESRLAWFIEAKGDALFQYIWISADNGALLLTFSQLAEAKYRTVYSAGSTDSPNGTLVRVEGEPDTGDADNDNAYLFAGVTYDYFLNSHGRDSWDNLGGELQSLTHYCPADKCPNYANAFWSGSKMVYGNGFASADDVVGHELTHAITQATAGLFYYQQSGALNESFSDIFGETIDLLSQAGSGNDSPAVRWQIGEDLQVGPFRNMMDPTLFNDPDRIGDAAHFACFVAAFRPPASDHGGVHTNSGVPNHAYALIVDGGTFNGRTVSGIGLAKAAKIEYRALTSYLTSGSGFADDYNSLIQSCNDLTGTIGITGADCAEVRTALDAVEMDEPLVCAGAAAAPPRCASGQPSFVYEEGFENTFDNWIVDTDGFGSWGRDHVNAKTGEWTANGNDPRSLGMHSMTMVNSVAIPAGAFLYFDHLFEFEPGSGGSFDGGILELSSDGGLTWQSASPLFSAGLAYNGTLAPVNPLGAVNAWVGSSFGYTGTRFNLDAYAGQNAKLRFTIGTDDSVSSLGWRIDNIGIYTCVTPGPFTDDPLVALTTQLKAVHIIELRARINAVRATRLLPAVVWVNDVLSGSPVRSADILEMRIALDAAYGVAGITPPLWSDAALPAGMPVKAAHITQLRDAVKVLE